MFQLTETDIKVLRILNGEDVPDMCWGAAMAICCEDLRRWGYAKGTYEITEKGRAYLESLDK